MCRVFIDLHLIGISELVTESDSPHIYGYSIIKYMFPSYNLHDLYLNFHYLGDSYNSKDAETNLWRAV